MALILEITRGDGSVVTTPLEGTHTKIDARPGEQFRLIDAATGQPAAGLDAIRAGNALIVEGLPEQAALELSDFFKQGEGEEACVLAMPEGDLVAPTAAPALLMAQNSQATPATTTDAPATATAESAAANPALSTGKIAIGAIAAVGVAAAASGSDDTPAPAPTPTAPPAPTGLDVEGDDTTIDATEAADGITVTGTAQAGSTVTVQMLDGSSNVVATATATADATTGAFTATIAQGDVPADGSYTFSAAAANSVGTGTAATLAVTLDTAGAPAPTPSPTPPPAPTGLDLEGVDDTIDASEAADGITVTGTAEANSNVTVQLINGASAVVATATATANGAGAFSATIAQGDVPGTDGSYTVSVTAANGAGTGPAATTPMTLAANTVTGTAGADTIVAGTANTVNGGDGADIILGDGGAGLRNGGFDFWASAGTGADVFGVGAALGWSPSFGNSPPAGADPNVGFNVSAFGGGNGAIEFVVPGGGAFAGDYNWETAFDGNSGGGGLTQTVNTVAGQTYQLQVTVDTASIDTGNDGTSLDVQWGGTSVAFFDAPTGTWLGTAPTETTNGANTIWTFTLPAAASGTTALSLIAFEDYSPASVTPGDGDGVGMQIVDVSLASTATANADTIDGGNDNDLIWGQGGDDALTGGAGSDAFVYSMGEANGADTISDFTVGADIIRLINVADAVGGASAQAGDGTPPTSTTSDPNLDAADLTDAAQAIDVQLTDNGNGTGVLTLTFSGTGGSAGSVAATVNDFAAVDALIVGNGSANAADLTALEANGIISWTGDGFNNGLAI